MIAQPGKMPDEQGVALATWSHSDPGYPRLQYRERPADPLRPDESPHWITERSQHALDPTPGVARMYVKLPKPRMPGGLQFWDNVPARDAMPGWTEICSTPYPDNSLAPVPQVGCKSWYNSYVYVPEQRSHTERQFMDRFVQGPDGEWLDAVKARRMTDFYDDHAEEEEKQRREREEIASGKSVMATPYVDCYSGSKMVNFQGMLMPEEEMLERYKLQRSDWADNMDMLANVDGGLNWDNLRIPWPFGRPDRNKKISQHAYEWFDRRNTYIPTDRSYEFLEMPSMYVDKEMYGKWRTSDDQGPLDIMQDVALRTKAFDDYPYRI